MKINHVDCSIALKFQWTCIPSNHGNQRKSSPNNASNNIPSSQAFPRSRFHHAACSLGKFVYIFGGKDRYSPLRDLWRFDTVTQEWNQVEDAKCRIPHLQGHTMLAYKSQLLIFGGTFSDTSEDTPLWIYNTDLNYVHKFCCESFTVRPVGRREHSAVIYKTSMYIYGGFLDSSGSTDEFWAFSIEEEEWRMIRRHKPGKRHGHVAVVADAKMWLHGGMRGLMALSDLWNFSFGTNTWNKVRTIGVAPALSNHTAHVVDNSIILFGGSKNGSLSQDFWMFRFDTLTWRHVSTQNGDLCPPITLHSSVLLTSALVQNTITDRTQSVPQLKGKSILSSEMKSVRPWTSPTVTSADSELNNPSSAASHIVDILCLDTLGKDLDGNNNNSDEDIHHMPETGTEAETSFCSEDHDQTPYDSTKEQQLLQNCAWITDPVLGHLVCSSQQGLAAGGQHNEGTRLRSASAENCGDAIPLLSRFHSVTSEVDLGESNLTITLSDEEIFDPVLSEQDAGKQLQKDNLSTDFDRYGTNYGEDFGGSISGAYLNSLFSEKGFVTKKELFESLAMFKKERDNELLNLDLSHCKDSAEINVRVIADPSSMLMNTFKVNDKNAAVSNFQSTGHTETNSFSQNMFEPCGKSSFMNCLSNDYQHLAGETESLHPKLHCVSDLIIEDLESSDISEIFHNIKISCPSRPYLRSSSLKDLYSAINYNDDYTESKFRTCVLTKNQITRSCGSFLSWQNSQLYEEKVKCQQKFLIGNTRESALEMQKNKKHSFSQSEVSSGKYIKNITSVALRNPSHLPRPRAKTSIGTQTTGSQTLLPGVKVQLNMDQDSKGDHFMASISANVEIHKHGAGALSAQRRPEPVAMVNSIFKNTNVCILVIGGQIESHGFQAEPIKMWRCCLY